MTSEKAIISFIIEANKQIVDLKLKYSGLHQIDKLSSEGMTCLLKIERFQGIIDGLNWCIEKNEIKF